MNDEQQSFDSGGHTIVESIENRDYVVNKISDELGEIIRILQLVTIDDVLLNEFDEDEQHNLKKLLVREWRREDFRMNCALDSVENIGQSVVSSENLVVQFTSTGRDLAGAILTDDSR